MVSFVIVESPERFALPVRGRTAQEKRDSENRLIYLRRVETISCGLCVR